MHTKCGATVRGHWDERFPTLAIITGWADDSGGEELGAGEFFLSGITACAVNMIERIASEEETPLDWMDVSIEAYRDPDAVQGEVTLYADVRVHLQMWGVSDEDGQRLVEIWKQR